MSQINGDKARYNRIRKQKLARRIRNWELRKRLIPAGTEAPAKKQ